MTNEAEEQVSLFAPDTWCGKTSQERSARAAAEISPQSSRKRSALSSRKPPNCLCLIKGGAQAGCSWATDGAWLGELSTRNIGECPSAAVESRLSQILEDAAPRKYYLSAKACAGILRRAERRGKHLPEALKTALEKQCGAYKETE